MYRNVAGQKLTVFAYDRTTGDPKTGDAANITAYVAKDNGAVVQLTDTTASESDAVNARGYYRFDLTQAETDADKLEFSAKSTTANIVVLAKPDILYTSFQLANQAHGGASAIFNLKQLALNSTDATNPLYIQATQGGVAAIRVIADADAAYLQSTGSFAAGLRLAGGEAALRLQATANGHGILTEGSGTGQGGRFVGGATGPGAQFIGGSSGARGAVFTGTGNGQGIAAFGSGAGCGILAFGGAGTPGLPGAAGVEFLGGSIGTGTAPGHGMKISKGNGSGDADDILLGNSDAPTLATAIWAATSRTLTGTIQTLDALNTALVAEHDATQALLVKIKAAVYDSVTRVGAVLTLSNSAKQTIDGNGRTTVEP